MLKKLRFLFPVCISRGRPSPAGGENSCDGRDGVVREMHYRVSVSEPTVSPSQRLWASSTGDREPAEGLRPPVE